MRLPQRPLRAYGRGRVRLLSLEQLAARRLLAADMNIGAVRPGTGETLTQLLDTQALTGRMAGDENAEITFEYGLKSGAVGAGTTGNDIALAGDFNGVGFDQAVVARGLPGGELLWLGDTDRDTTDEYQFLFGLNTDTPLIGDFNGDGYDDVAVIRENVGFLDWYVHYASPGLSPYPTDGSVLVAHASFTFGLAGDQPVAGDFGNDAGLSPERVADGVDDVAVARNNGGSYEWFFHYAESQGNPYPLDPGTGTGQSIDDQYIFGASSAIAVVGDWDNDGDDNVGVVDDSGATPANPADWSLDTTDDGGTAEITLQYGVESDQFVVGRWADRYWDGEIGNDWSNEGNWSGNTLPATGEDVVIIQPGSISSINHDSGTTTIGSLTTADGGEVRVTGGSLIVDGEYNSDTTVLVAGGTLRLNDTLNALSLELASGTLAIGVDNALGATPLLVGGGSIEAVSAARSLDSNIELNGQLTVIGSQDLALSGILNGAGGLTLNTSADLTLSGANTYDGLTSVDLGTLILTGAGTLGSTVGGTKLTGTGGLFDVELELAPGVTSNENVTLAGSTAVLRGPDATLAGDVILAADNKANIHGGGGIFTLSGNISGSISGVAELDILGSDVLLTGNNSYSARTRIIAGGRLRMGSTTALPSTSIVRALQGTLDLNGFDVSVGTLEAPFDTLGVVSIGANTLTIGDNNAPSVFEGIIEGTGNLIKIGSGIQTLNGDSAFSGTTTVRAGELRVNGKLPGNIIVEAGAVVGGSGSVGNTTIQDFAIAAPGNSPGILNTDNFTLAADATLEIELGGTTPGNTPTSHDQVNVTGAVILGGTLDLQLFGTYTPTAGDSFVIINNDSDDPITQTFSGVPEGGLVTDGANFYRVTYQGGLDGNDVVLTALASTSVTLSSGILLISDTSGKPDTLAISTTPTEYVITDTNGNNLTTDIAGASGDGTPTITVPVAAVFGTQVIVNTGDGDDSIFIDSSFDTLAALSVSIDGQSGVDSITWASANSFSSLSVTAESIILSNDVTTFGSQSWNGAVVLGANATLTSTVAGNITFASTVDGARSLTVNTTGITDFAAAVGDSTPLTAVTTNVGGTIKIGGNITTSGNQTFNDAANLSRDVTLESAGGSVRFSNTVNGTTAGAESLTINGDVFFGSHVGQSTELEFLTVSGSTATNIDQRVINTAGAQTYGGPFQAVQTRTLNSSGGGNITFASTVDAAVNGDTNFTINTAGVTLFQGDVGATTLLGYLTTDAAGSTVFGGSTVRTRHDQTYHDPLTLNSSVSFVAEEGNFAANLTFADVTVGANNLQAHAHTTLTVGGDIIATVAGSLRLTSTGDLLQNSSSDISTQDGDLEIKAGMDLNTSGTITSLTGAVEFASGGELSVSGNLDHGLGGTTIDFDGTSGVVSGTISGDGTLTKVGSGAITLSAANTYAGATHVDAGALLLGHELALGSTAGETIVASGAALDTNGFSNSESIELNGDGVDGTGALRNTGTAASFLSGHVELVSDTTIAATVATIDLMGVVSGGGNLTKIGNDFLTLGNSGNDFTGDVTVVQGVLTSGRDGLGAVAGQTIINGGQLRLQTGSYSKLELVVFNSGTLMADGAVTFPGPITLNADISVSVDTPLSLSGVIDGTGGLLKTGTDTLTLNGVNSYTGTTTVISGTLAGFGTLPGPVEVANGATLAPGNSPGRLNTGNLDLQGGAKLEVEIGGTNLTPTAQYDQVNVTGTVMLDGELNVAFTEGYAPNTGDTFTIINNNGTDLITTTFNGLAEGAEFLVDNVTFTISYQGGEGGNDVVLTAQYKTFVVTTTQDGIDNGSLRQAISDANASPGRDRIEFDLAEGSSGYVSGKWNILPVSNDLPDITEGVVIDGTTAPGYVNTPVIVLGGSYDFDLTDGLRILGSQVTIRGLEINSFAGSGIRVTGSGATNVLIQDNIIHTNFAAGILVDDGASDIVIDRNLISNNSDEDSFAASGIDIIGPGTLGVTVTSNLIGLNSLGDAWGNYGVGILIQDSGGNTIGTPAGRNIISGNKSNGADDGTGILITGAGSSSNLIQHNYIGTNISGTGSRSNAGSGIRIQAGANNNTVNSNTISGNAGHGIEIDDSDSNIIAGNYIGTNSTATAAIGNLQAGISIVAGATNTRVGGSSTSSRNIVSGNIGSGVSVVGAGLGTKIQGNLIGTDRTSLIALGNASTELFSAAGVFVSAMSGKLVIIGTDGDEAGNDALEGNVISGNFRYGIHLEGDAPISDGHIVAGNNIGVDFSGTVVVPNQAAGIHVVAARDIRIGTNSDEKSDELEANVISGNRNLGTGPTPIAVEASAIFITDSVFGDSQSSSDIMIAGNFIGTDRNTSRDLGNQLGILAEYAPGIRIGGGQQSDRNYVGFNDGYGISIVGTSGAVVSGNSIGVTATGGSMGNGGAGILLAAAADGISLIETTGSTIGGVTAELGNTIGFNNQGLWLQDLTSTTGSSNVFANNVFRDNLGLSIDVGTAGLTFNDGLEGPAELLDYPVLTSAEIAGTDLVIRGFSQPGRSIELYLSEATFTTRGHGTVLLTAFTEGDLGVDLDTGTGSYAAPHTSGPTVNANLFEVKIPIPESVSFGSLLTAITVGSTSEFGNSIQVGQIVANAAPIITLGSPPALVTGEALTIAGSFTDADSTSWTATVDFGDGTGVQPLALSKNNTFTLSHVYGISAGSPFTITVRVLDGGGRLGVATTTVAVANSAPEVTFNNVTFTSSVNERAEAKISGSFTDPGITDSHFVRVNWDDGNTIDYPINAGARTFEATHQYADDGVSDTQRDTYRVEVTISDTISSNTTPIGLYTLEVVNVRPNGLTVDTPVTVTEGETTVLTGSFFDPGLSDSHTITIFWGDKSSETIELPSVVGQTAVRGFAASHAYADNPDSPATTYEITVQVVDDDERGTPMEVKRTIEVTNVVPTAPSVTFSSATGNSITESQSVTIDVNFNDAGVQDKHEVTVDWGDKSELKVYQLDPGIVSLPDLSHVYRNDPQDDVASYTITVRVRDKDMPSDVFISSTAEVFVANVAPSIEAVAPSVEALRLLVRDASNAWVEVAGVAEIVEGDEVRIEGRYLDDGPDDLHDVDVTWSSGITTPALVDPVTRTFSAEFRYTDDFAVNTSNDMETITVNLSDRDGGITSATRQVRVSNVDPTVFFLPAAGASETSVRLVPEVFDPGFEADSAREPLTYSWELTVAGTTLKTASTADFTFNPSEYSGTVVVELTVNDNDLGVGSFRTAFKFGTSLRDNIVLVDEDFTMAGTNSITVLAFGGTDVINATQVSAGNNLILDGSSGTDYLFGGSGNDTYILHEGDDSANVAVAGGINPGDPLQEIIVEIDENGGTRTITLPTPNEMGNDRYVLAPNSVLTVIDNSGLNTLDFSISTRGVTFDLSETRTSTLTSQDVSPIEDPGKHFVAAQGQFNTLTGSSLADALSAASGTALQPTKVDGGSGNDHLFAGSGTQYVSFLGGNDADTLSISGTGVSDIFFGGGADVDVLLVEIGGIVGGIDFEGDAGADQLVVYGNATDIDFNGGADVDILMVELGGTATGIDFEGDLGADQLIVNGTATDINFEGDLGADELIVNGTATNIAFGGGADSDTLIVGVDSLVSGHISFEGDLGADQLVVFGQAGDIDFGGGADADILIIQVGGVGTNINFEGDLGTDQLVILGEATDIEFRGGADADVLELGADSVSGGISFEGDIGADELIVFGDAGGIVFEGGADSDRFIVQSGAVITTRQNESQLAGTSPIQVGLDFRGDIGADQLIILGDATDIVFGGGADADILQISSGGSGSDISFEGDLGADELVIFGDASNIDFGGGADSDTLTIALGGMGTDISFEGDIGADELVIFGDGSEIVFMGGADADVLAIATDGVGFHIDFDGDVGADELVVLGDAVDIDFDGGADADALIIGSTGNASDISFEGDLGVDELIVFGDAGGIIFGGGADTDRVFIYGSGAVTSREHASPLSGNVTVSVGVEFRGDAGADQLFVYGSAEDIVFGGGADADVLAIAETGSVGNIDFDGDAGADVLVNLSDDVGSIVFGGGADADVLQSVGDNVGSISFEGDAGDDVLIVDGTGIGDIVFMGGADADVLLTSGSDFGDISFEGDTDDGNLLDDKQDTLINLASAATGSKITFNGYGGLDVLRNDGDNWTAITFRGDSGADVLVNNGLEILEISFEGDSGDDILENNGTDIGLIVFNGGADADILANDGTRVSAIIFDGGADADILLNTGDGIADISFEGDSGADELINTGEGVSDIVFEGDDGNDRITNYGARFSSVTFFGGAGNDRFVNLSSATGSADLTFLSESYSGGMGTVPNYPDSVFISRISQGTITADTGADLFLNFADKVTGIVFGGGADVDILQNSGAYVTDITFGGDIGDDQLLNVGNYVTDLTFTGDDGNDLAENRGLVLMNFNMLGGAGRDTLVNRGDSANMIFLDGGDGVDLLLNQADHVGVVSMIGRAASDRFQNDGSDIGTLFFDMGDGQDIFQNNGDRIDLIEIDGGSGADDVFNNGNSVKFIDFEGGDGSDSLINTGANIGDAAAPATLTGIFFDGGLGEDLLRIQNTGIVRVEFLGGDGNDTLLHNGFGGSASFSGGPGDDVATVRGAIESLIYLGQAGNDEFILSGSVGPANATEPTAIVDGGDDHDRYEFSISPAAWVLIGETFDDAGDNSLDTLDFSALISDGLLLDLSSTEPQLQPGTDLTIQFADAQGIENVIGTSTADRIDGNERDNYIGGEEFFAQPPATPVAERSETQWVYLDFDTYTETLAGEYDYPADVRQEILERIQAVYYGSDALQWAASTGEDPYNAPSRWFNIRFTLNELDIPVIDGARVDHISVNFNQTPSYGRAGGESSEVDFANFSFSGSATVQVNGLLGGLLTAEELAAEGAEDIYADAAVGSNKPAATRENFVALSTKIAAHEVAHLFGLRHYDAFGPIGFGIHSPPGAGDFKPGYAGPAAAFETFDHIIGSPASVGSNRFIDLGQLFFGEREAIKVTLATSNLATVSNAETANTWELPQPLNWATLNVPNTLNAGVNAAKDFSVQAVTVAGVIELTSTANPVSESDFYQISGQVGDLITIEVSSKALRRFTNNGVDGYIDSVIRLYAANGELVYVFNTAAVNDDEFESTDSILMDVRLPVTGDYIVEVDTFKSADPFSQAIADQLSGELLEIYVDSTSDTDVGEYELLIYKFAKANAENGIDTLFGGAGIDVLNGGPGEDYSLSVNPQPAGAALEGSPFTRNIAFSNPGGSGWMASVDFGDGTSTDYADFDPLTGLDISHTFADDGPYAVTVTIQNDDFTASTALQNSGSVTFNVDVANVAPLPSIADPVGELVTNSIIAFSGSASDPGDDTLTFSWNMGDGTLLTGAAVSHSYAALGNYSVTLTVTDDNGDSSAVSRQFTIVSDASTNDDDIVTATIHPVGGFEYLGGNQTIGDRITLVFTPEQLGGLGAATISVIQAYLVSPVGEWLTIPDTDGDGPDKGYSVAEFEFAALAVLLDDEIIDITEYFILIGGPSDIMLGTSGNDSLSGAAGTQIIFGLGGNDTLNGGSGRDCIFAGSGNDVIEVYGNEAEFDMLRGGGDFDKVVNVGSTDLVFNSFNIARDVELLDGNKKNVRGNGLANTFDFRGVQMKKIDQVLGDDGADTIYASTVTHNVTYDGGQGNDQLLGQNKRDILLGGGGDDTIEGGGDKDIINGGIGMDTIHAGSGDDELQVNGSEAEYDVMEGGGDFDTVINIGRTDLVFNSFNIARDIERLDGNKKNVRGNGLANTLDFRGVQMKKVEQVLGDDGADTIYASTVTHDVTYDGGNGNDHLLGQNKRDILLGGGGDDTIEGGDDRDILDGGTGTDVINGGRGSDVLSGGADLDRFVFDVDDDSGEDEVTDFSDGLDKIDLTALGTSFAALSLSSGKSGGGRTAQDSLITLPSGKKIRIVDTVLADLDVSDFLF